MENSVDDDIDDEVLFGSHILVHESYVARPEALQNYNFDLIHNSQNSESEESVKKEMNQK